MTGQRLAAGLLIGGLLLAVMAALLPGSLRWMPVDPAMEEHMSALAIDADGVLVAGSQSGRLWRRVAGDDWIRFAATPGDRPVTTLAADGQGLLVGTGDGLFRPDGHALLPSGRISDIHTGENSALAVATGNRILIRREEHWEDTGIHESIGDSSVYRVHRRHADGTWLAGTVGQGVWARQPDGNWQPEGENLPVGVKVFALVETEHGVLLAGTDQGLFWQATPGTAWRRLDGGFGDRRVLFLLQTLHADAHWLYAASDDGVHRARLIHRDNWLGTRGRWEHLPSGPPGLDRSVSHIVAAGEELWIAAGSLYTRDSVPPGVRQPLLFLAGLLLVGAAVTALHGSRR